MEIGIIVTVLVNIIVTAFSAGKLWQKVNGLCDDSKRMRQKLDNTDTHLDKLAERIARMEGKMEAR